MKLRKILLSFAILLLILGKVKAQDYTNYNLYLQNPVLYNPAYALDESKIRAFVNTHLQWSGFEGAPKVNTFGVYGSFLSNMGIGLNVNSRKQGIMSNTNISLDYAYRVNFSSQHFLTLGISLGYLMDDIKVGSVANVSMDDPTFGSNNYIQNTLSSKEGIVYYYKGLQAQLVFPQLFQRQSMSNYWIGMLSYDYIINPLWNVKPSFLYRTASTTNAQLETSVMFTYKKMVSGHVGYNTNKSMQFGLGLTWKAITLGYAYQHENNFISTTSKGTNEIQLIYRFGLGTNIVPKDNSLVSLKSIADSTKENKLDSAKLADQQKLDEAKRLADEKRFEEQRKFEEQSLQEQKKIEEQLNDLLKKVGELDKLVKQGENGEDINMNSGSVYNLGYVGFETGTSTLKKEAFGVLDKYASSLKKSPNSKVDISGYTDNTGSDASNNALSKARAQSCKAYLESRGISADRLKSAGFGSKNPAVPNTTSENRARNRRVEFKVN